MSGRGESAANGAGPGVPPRVTPEIAAEAAVWVARLHGPSRSPEMERQFSQWQALSAAHRHAFERSTEVWLEVPNAARASGLAAEYAAQRLDSGGKGKSSGTRGLFVLTVCVCMTVAAGAFALHTWRAGTDYRTAVGESQTLVLDDGTRMSLNTDTRARVEFSSKQRTVSIKEGEAAFEVAKDATRPFVVRAGGSEVVAIGTVFSVRLTSQNSTSNQALAVTLLEGQVSVRRAADGAGDLSPWEPLMMRPGERVRLVKDGGTKSPAAQPQVDRPGPDQILAWRRNEAVFENASLTDAVAEMNRYSRTPVVLTGDLAQASWQVSGRFRTGDNAAFARALATLHNLVVREHEGRLELSSTN